MIGTVLLAFDITEQAAAERSRREFTANVSHELKTPLQSITGSAELLENELVKSEDVPHFIRVCSHKCGCDIMKKWNYEKSNMNK